MQSSGIRPWRYALRQFWRGLRRQGASHQQGGNLRLLTFSIVLAVGAATSVDFFTQRVDRGLQQGSGEAIGADLLMRTRQPMPAELRQTATDLGLRQVMVTEFPSMLIRQRPEQDELTALVTVKAVEPGYPLRGQVWLADQPLEKGAPVTGVPEIGEAWVDARVFAELDAQPGDEVQLGNLKLRLTRAITREPDRAGGWWSLAPRILINHSQLASSGLVDRGSRLLHGLLLAGDDQALQALRDQYSSDDGTLEWLSASDARPEISSALERAARFLDLAALAAVMIAAVAVALCAWHYAITRRDEIALIKTLGVQRGHIGQIVVWQLTWVILFGVLMGSALGWLAQFGLVAILGVLADMSLPAPGFSPLLSGAVIAASVMAGFAGLPLWRLRNTPAMRILRSAQDSDAGYGLAALFGGLSVAGLVLWRAGNIKLALGVIGGTLVTVLFLTLLAMVLIRATAALRSGVGLGWRYGLGRINRYRRASLLQSVALGLGLMVILLLSTVRADLLSAWRSGLSEDAPSHFLINVQPHQVEVLGKAFADLGMPQPELYPMVRARLTHINDQPIDIDALPSEDGRRLLRRGLNLSVAGEFPAGNTLTAGRWWTADEYDQPWLSVEDYIVIELGVNLDDRLAFELAGERFELTVKSTREVDWSTLQANFFVVSPPQALQDLPATWIGTVKLSDEQASDLGPLFRAYPNVTVLDIGVIAEQIRGIMDRVNLAVQYVFLFTLAAGLLVLMAAIQTGLSERQRESAILRSLGGHRRQILQAVAGEYLALGLIAGLVAAGAAQCIAWALAWGVLDLDYVFSPLQWILGAVLGGIGVTTAGVLGSLPVLRQRPVEALR